MIISLAGEEDVAGKGFQLFSFRKGSGRKMQELPDIAEVQGNTLLQQHTGYLALAGMQ